MECFLATTSFAQQKLFRILSLPSYFVVASIVRIQLIFNSVVPSCLYCTNDHHEIILRCSFTLGSVLRIHCFCLLSFQQTVLRIQKNNNNSQQSSSSRRCRRREGLVTLHRNHFDQQQQQ